MSMVSCGSDGHIDLKPLGLSTELNGLKTNRPSSPLIITNQRRGLKPAPLPLTKNHILFMGYWSFAIINEIAEISV